MHMFRYDLKYSSETIDSMMPWELDVEMSFILASIKKEAASRNSN